MGDLLSVILPVFLVIGAGYLAAWQGWIKDNAVDGLMAFAQKFAIPMLLFRGISTLDLGAHFDFALLGPFYIGALSGFTLGLLGGRFLFGRSWEDSVAIGFCGLFSNSLLLGLPITERAYGAGGLDANYAIIAIHAPLCFGVGITAMEIARAGGLGSKGLFRKVLRAMFSNALVIGIIAGFIVNLGRVPVPEVGVEAVDLIARAGLPAALFGLGGVLRRYRPEGDMRVILYVCAISLLVHPGIAWVLGLWTGLDDVTFRSMIITAAMAPGVNAYLFADMYGAARRVAASTVLIGTALTLGTALMWLTLLP